MRKRPMMPFRRRRFGANAKRIETFSKEMTMMKTILALSAACVMGLFTAAKADDHSVGPHKGAVAEWGDEVYHVEVCIDSKTGEVTVYIYGNHDDFHKKTMKAIDSKELKLTIKGDKPLTVTLAPKPQKDDPKDHSTMFTGKDDGLKTDKKLEGSISGKVGAKPYTGEFKQK